MDPAVRDGLARSWKALMTIGVIAIAVGCVAIVVPAVSSVGTAIFIGWILLIAGAFLVAGAFSAHSIGTVVLRLLWAFLTVIVGLYLIVEPHNGTLTLTLVLGIYFLFMGLTRVTVAFLGRGRPNAGLVGLSGFAGLLIGILILAKLPELRRLGDRPPGRHRPDLRRLDPDSVALVGRDLSQSNQLARARGASAAGGGVPLRPLPLLRFRGELATGPGHGGGRGHPHALEPAEDAASRLRPGDGRLAGPRRARGRGRPGRRDRLPRRATSPPACPEGVETVIQPQADGTGGAIRAALPLIRGERDRAGPLRRPSR